MTEEKKEEQQDETTPIIHLWEAEQSTVACWDLSGCKCYN